MTLLNNLLPIIEKKEKSNNSITTKDKEYIYTILNEEARLERLASQSINSDPNATHYLLEPIPRELFKLYQYEEDTAMESITTTDTLSLIPVGKLNLFDDSDSETVDLSDETHVKPVFDIAEYQTRRRKQNTTEILEESSPVPTTPGLSVDTPMMARSNIALLPIAVTTTTAQQPVVPVTPVQQQQQQQQTMTDGYQSNSQEMEDMVNQVLNDGTDNNQVMAQAHNELEATGNTTAAVTKEPAPSSTTTWYSDQEIILAHSPVAADLNSSTHQAIYGFPKQMIPIYTTKNQQTEYDKVTLEANTKNTLTSTNFKKLIDTLNFPNANLDLALEEHWATSGKTVFIKHFLTSLSNEDKTILFATSNLNDEANLYQILNQSLHLTCVRVGSILDDVWDGEYGVIVKTQDKSVINATSTQKQQQFTAQADLIVCLDIRISSNHTILTKMSKMEAENRDQVPPAVWLITMGSIENLLYIYLKMKHAVLSEEFMRTDAFKSLIKAASQWPKENRMEFNLSAADNVISWFLSTSVNMTNYQYRSTLALPNTDIVAYLKSSAKNAPTAVTTLVQDNTTVDMEVDSDLDVETVVTAVEEVPILSDKLKAYIDDCLIPPFDVNTGQLTLVDRTDKFLSLLDSDKHIVEQLQQNIYVEYCNQVNTLKRQYEVAFKELQGTYQEKAVKFAATEN